MSDTQDDPLLGLLTDIAEAVATLAARVDAMEAVNALHQAQVNEALATIAEIATRTYNASKPSNALPDDIINANVMDAMIEQWPQGAVIGMSSHDRQLMSELDRHPIDAIDRLISRAEDHPDQNNANRLRMGTFLVLLKREKEKGTKPRRKALSAMGKGGDGEDVAILGVTFPHQTGTAAPANNALVHQLKLACRNLPYVHAQPKR